MQFNKHTYNILSAQSGLNGTGDVRPVVHARLTDMAVHISVRCISRTNEQIKSYESDLGMT